MTLKELFTNIANAIRSKTGSSATIKATDFATQISNIKLATGNATTSQVLSGYTFSNASGNGLTGAMTNRGTWTSTISPGGSVTIPAGYHNGSGKVSATGGTVFSEDKSATSTSHYSCTLSVSSSDLSGKYIAGFCYYAEPRTMGGDSYINCNFVHNGTTYSPSTSHPSKSTGTLSNGIKYTAYSAQKGHAVFFSKPVQLSSITCNSGSSTGQWVETDYLYLTMNGYK